MDQNYNRIEKAIGFITSRYKEQPDLEEIASHVHLSPYHFHRLFSEWAGVSPKKFLQAITVEHAKSVLREGRTLEETAAEVGFTSTSRLHDHFVTIEGMTPAEFRDGGAGLEIFYSVQPSPFGRFVVGSTHRGICLLLFLDENIDGSPEDLIRDRFPNARLSQSETQLHKRAASVLTGSRGYDMDSRPIVLHVKGTPFQLNIWRALLEIPPGLLVTYSDLAKAAGNPAASRAAGTAIGQNPVAYMIPCHRVIRSTGVIGHYHWGKIRKTAMIGYEQVRRNIQDQER